MEIGKRLIFDADVLLYRACFAAEHKDYIAEFPDGSTITYSSHKAYKEGVQDREHNLWIDHQVEPIEHAIGNIKSAIEGICRKLGSVDRRFILSGETNFRHRVATIKKYKGNRDPAHKPVHLQAAKDWLIKYQFADVADDIEADDLIGILASEDPKNSVIISNDKDLRQISCWHYNWTKPEEGVKYIGKSDAGRYFYIQLLGGDSTDNIQGIKGIGPQKAAKILEGCRTPAECERTALAAFRRHYGSRGDYHFLETGRLVRIRRSRDEGLWYPKHVELQNLDGMEEEGNEVLHEEGPGSQIEAGAESPGQSGQEES